MIIWQGRGGVTAIIIVLSILLVTAVLDKTSPGLPVWITYVAMAVLAASANAIFAAKYAQPHTRVVIDKQTGQELRLAVKHTLFWIPVRYWTYIILGYAVIGSIGEWVK
jgi:hypothetical protein